MATAYGEEDNEALGTYHSERRTEGVSVRRRPGQHREEQVGRMSTYRAWGLWSGLLVAEEIAEVQGPDDDRVVARTHPRRSTANTTFHRSRSPPPPPRQRPYCALYPASSWYSPAAPFHPTRACAERGFLPSRLALSVNDGAHHYLPPSIPDASTFCDPRPSAPHIPLISLALGGVVVLGTGYGR
ncbi:hypothetical protein C8J57DRAFT_1505283 [Mycena rebaudengoi]|nr:hypothetical protein C8J57DRAFT_1505283 [Mycena rebaudengoi]